MHAAVTLFGEVPACGVSPATTRRGIRSDAITPDRGGAAAAEAGVAERRRAARASDPAYGTAAVTGTPASVGYQPSRPSCGCSVPLRADAICDAWQRGADRTVVSWLQHRSQAHRSGRRAAMPLLVLTLRAPPAARRVPLDRLRIAVACAPDSGFSIPHQLRLDARCRRRAEPSLSLAVSARLMRVTHRPNPVRSPENREPQGSEMSSVASTQPGSPIPALGWSLHFHVFHVHRRPSCPSPSQASSPSSFFNLHVEGVGYLNRVRTDQAEEGSGVPGLHRRRPPRQRQ
jgi:hypothetical protein